MALPHCLLPAPSAAPDVRELELVERRLWRLIVGAGAAPAATTALIQDASRLLDAVRGHLSRNAVKP